MSYTLHERISRDLTNLGFSQFLSRAEVPDGFVVAFAPGIPDPLARPKVGLQPKFASWPNQSPEFYEQLFVSHPLSGEVWARPLSITAMDYASFLEAVFHLFKGYSEIQLSSLGYPPKEDDPFIVLGAPTLDEIFVRSFPKSAQPFSGAPQYRSGDLQGGASAQHPLLWDVFISHASEDKAAVAIPLKEALEVRGVSCWIDKDEIQGGDSLRQKIHKGIRHSRFSAVILSKAYFSKGWTNRELDGIVAMEVQGKQAILPIWHGVSIAEVSDFDISLAGKLARSTATDSIESMADEIVQRVRAARLSDPSS